MNAKIPFALLMALLVQGAASAQDLKSDWIKPEPGYAEKVLGTEIRAVDSADDNGDTRVTVAVPKALLVDAPEIQEIIVTARQSDDAEAPSLNLRHEWVANYDDDYYGLVLYLGRDQNLPFRLYFKVDDKP